MSISYYGYFTPLGGYGIANINCVKHLRRLGIDVSVHAKFAPREGSFEWEILNDEEREIFRKPFELQRIGIIETNPFDFDTNVSEIRIANTMCESDHVAPEWAEKLNGLNHILVPNEFNKKAFLNSGVTAPITIIPHGTDTEKFPYYDRPTSDVFVFGLVGYLDQHDRKGAFDAIRAFASEFRPEEPVRLILHSTDKSFGYYRNFTDERILTITRPYSFEELNSLYQSFDCFVFPSKAEGVGQPPREAMATGLPVILTKWSGLEDVALKEISYPLTNFKLEPRYNFIEQDGNWAVPSIEELMKTMRYVYEHQKEAKLKGKKAAEWIRKNQSWEVAAQKMKEFLEHV